MKITYPECQIEISVDEVIALMKFEKENEPRLKEKYWTGFRPDVPPVNLPGAETFLKMKKEDEAPEQLSHSESDQDSDKDNDQDEDRNNTEHTQPTKTQAIKASRPVDVLMDDGWVTFDSASKAAKALGVSSAWLGKSLKLGKTCNGHHVRYANPELDAVLSEIEANNKKPYEPSCKI